MKKITFEKRYFQVLKKALKIEDGDKPQKKKKANKKEVEVLSLEELNK